MSEIERGHRKRNKKAAAGHDVKSFELCGCLFLGGENAAIEVRMPIEYEGNSYEDHYFRLLLRSVSIKCPGKMPRHIPSAIHTG